MKIIQTADLVGDELLAAVAVAVRASYRSLMAEVSSMDLAQLQAYLAQHPDVVVAVSERGCAETLREAIRASHEPLLPDEDDIMEPTQADLWPLCEKLIERYGINLSHITLEPTELPNKPNKLWLADDDDFTGAGSSPREAILRLYVTLKLGAEVSL